MHPNTNRNPQPTTNEHQNLLTQTNATNQNHLTFQFQQVNRLPKLTLWWPSLLAEFLGLIWCSYQPKSITVWLNYLRAQVQEDAARSIAGLQLTEANYSNSVALLINWYGQHTHMRALLNIPPPSNNLSSLRECYDTIQTHVRSLSSTEHS